MASTRAGDDWPFSAIGNEAENLLAARERSSIPAVQWRTIEEWIDRARWYWEHGDDWLALSELCTAQRAYGHAQAGGSEAQFRSLFGSRAAKTRHAKSSTARAKEAIYNEYKKWRVKPKRSRKNQRTFAADMVVKHKHNVAHTTIAGWLAHCAGIQT